MANPDLRFLQDTVLDQRFSSVYAVWDLLIRRFGLPALKVGLIRGDKALGPRDMSAWPRVVSPDMVPLIEGHMKRILAGRADR